MFNLPELSRIYKKNFIDHTGQNSDSVILTDSSEEKYKLVFKKLSAKSNLTLTNLLLRFLSDKQINLNFPAILTTVDGEEITKVTDDKSKNFFCTLYSFPQNQMSLQEASSLRKYSLLKKHIELFSSNIPMFIESIKGFNDLDIIDSMLKTNAKLDAFEDVLKRKKTSEFLDTKFNAEFDRMGLDFLRSDLTKVLEVINNLNMVAVNSNSIIFFRAGKSQEIFWDLTTTSEFTNIIDLVAQLIVGIIIQDRKADLNDLIELFAANLKSGIVLPNLQIRSMISTLVDFHLLEILVELAVSKRKLDDFFQQRLVNHLAKRHILDWMNVMV